MYKYLISFSEGIFARAQDFAQYCAKYNMSMIWNEARVCTASTLYLTADVEKHKNIRLKQKYFKNWGDLGWKLKHKEISQVSRPYLRECTWSICHLSVWSLNVLDRLCRNCSAYELHLDSSDLRIGHRTERVRKISTAQITPPLQLTVRFSVVIA